MSADAKPADPKAPDKAPEPRKTRGRLRAIVLVVALVVLLGGAAGGFYVWRSGQGAPGAEPGTAAARPQEHAALESTGVLTFEPFVVNLADPGGQRFLRATLRLVVDSEEAAKEIQEDEVRMLRVRSAVLELLSQQVADTLVTAAGKSALKQVIAERANPLLEKTKVTDVLFAEFVVQF